MSDKNMTLLTFFFFFFFSSSFFIHSSWVIPIAAAFSTISNLPGFDGPLPFHLETGYVTVDEFAGAQLFYYFFKSERDPANDPLVLSFTGGPGCTALTGVTCGIGPLKFKIEEYNGNVPTLVLNPYSWTKVSSMIFLDTPIGTGFSFSNSTHDYRVGDSNSVDHIYLFLKKWFMAHPEFLSNPFYIGGDSYAGKIAPLVTYRISQGIASSNNPAINLKGYIIGNPVTGRNFDKMARFQHARDLWITTDEFYLSSVIACQRQSFDEPTTEDCARAVDELNKLCSELDVSNVLSPVCPNDPLLATKVLETPIGSRSTRTSPIQCVKTYSYFLSNQWANKEVVREALHVKKGTIGKWKRCNFDMTKYYEYDVPSSIPYHLENVNNGYSVLVYSGDHDIVVPIVGTKEWILSLNLTITDQWRPWWVDDQVGGYTMVFHKDLTFATVKGGGHSATVDRTKECFAMFESWISSRIDLKKSTSY